MVDARGTPGMVWIGFLTDNSIHVLNVLGGTPTDAGLLAAVGSLSYAGSATQAGRITAMFDTGWYPCSSATGRCPGASSFSSSQTSPWRIRVLPAWAWDWGR
jgi:hypothetical protein